MPLRSLPAAQSCGLSLLGQFLAVCGFCNAACFPTCLAVLVLQAWIDVTWSYLFHVQNKQCGVVCVFYRLDIISLNIHDVF